MVPRFSSDSEPSGEPTFTTQTVVVVDYVPTPTPSDTAEGDPAVPDATAQGLSSQAAGTSTSVADTDGPTRPGGDDLPRDRGSHSGGDPVPENAADTCPTLPGVFLILSQDYTTELIEARIPLDTQPAVALLYVSQARSSRDRDRFPTLCAVEPQPLGSQAVLLALPAWAPDGAVAAFDLTGIDGRIFALNIGRRVTRAGLFQAAELPDDPRIEVLVGSMPWPVPSETATDIRHGDLIQFVFAGRGHTIVSSFQDMLRSAQGWHPDPRFIRAFSGWNLDDTWIVNDDRHFLLHVTSARRRYVRQDLAFRMRIPADELILRPPQPRIQALLKSGLGYVQRSLRRQNVGRPTLHCH